MKLIGQKVILRTIELTDYLEIYENAQDINIALFDGTAYPFSQLESKKYIQKISKHTQKRKGIYWAVIEKKSGRLAGIISLKFKRKLGPVASLGYWLGMSFRSKGLMSESLRMVMQLAFTELGMEKLFGRVYLPNRNSARLLEKYGFQLEGIQRKQIHRMGMIFDACLYGLLKEEYLEKRSS